MAATGFTPIQLFRTSTGAAVPLNTSLADGELAINLTDEKLYFKNAGGTVKLLAANITPVANGGTGLATLTANNVIIGNGTGAPLFVAPGTSGNVLTSNGTTWTSTAGAAGNVTLDGVQTLTNKTINIANNTLTGVQASLVSGTNIKTIGGASVLGSGDLVVGGGSMILLSTVTASNSATVDVETTFDSTYDAYMLVVSGATPTTDTVSLLSRMKIGGSYVTTSTYISTGGYTSLAGNQATTLATAITLVSSVWGNDAASSCDVVMYIFNPSSTAFKKQIRYEATSIRIDTGATQIQTRSGVGSNDNTGALTGMRFFASSGNINAGKFRLYGIANS